MVSIPACHAGDPGSIPGNGEFENFCPEDPLYIVKIDLRITFFVMSHHEKCEELEKIN